MPEKILKTKNSITSVPKVNALLPPPIGEICKVLGIQALTIEWLAGDGSDRCYYRLRLPDTPETLVLMQLSGSDAAALKDHDYDWINVGKTLEAQGIPVPKLLHQMPHHAALIIEDYGDVMLESVVHDLYDSKEIGDIEKLYEKCFGLIAKMLKIKPQSNSAWCRRSFDAERFHWELNFFMTHYAQPVCAIFLNDKENLIFQKEAEDISKFLASFSKYFVHRDFHSRNLMFKNGDLAMIDFQDARYGSAAYDLVSLVFDNYVPLAKQERIAFLKAGLQFVQTNLGKDFLNEIELHWKALALQRQLKAIGSYGYLTIKKEKGDYLKYVKPALDSLDMEWVFDNRWPFLSKHLIELLKEKSK